jgi:hypothetical protein
MRMKTILLALLIANAGTAIVTVVAAQKRPILAPRRLVREYSTKCSSPSSFIRTPDLVAVARGSVARQQRVVR